MNCKAVQSNLSAYLDRELGHDEFYEVRAHLVACSECQMEEQDLRCLKSLLSEMPSPEPSVDFESRLIGSLRQPAARKVSRLPFQLWAAAVFACLALLSAFFTLKLKYGAQVAVASAKPAPSFAAEVRQDQVYEADASDPHFGAPMLTTAEYGR